jgi:hypothetical protein
LHRRGKHYIRAFSAQLGDGRPFDALEEAHQPCLAGRIELADPRDMAEQVAADA